MAWPIRTCTVDRTVYVSIDDLIIGFVEDRDLAVPTNTVKDVLDGYVKELKRVKKETVENK